MPRPYPTETVTDRCSHLIDEAERDAGRTLDLYRRVKILGADVDRVAARVDDADGPYQVQLAWDFESRHPALEVTCECPAPRDGRLCRHVWATLIVFEQRDGRIPGREPLEVLFPDEPPPWPEKNRQASVYSGMFRFNWYWELEHDEAVDVEPDDRWQQELEALKPSLSPPVRRREVLYTVDMWSSPDAQRLIIDLSQRAVTKSGKLGSVKKLKLSEWEALEAPDPADRKILSLLLATAATQGVTRRYAYRSADDKPRRYGSGVVPSVAYQTALPLLCSTGRLRVFRDYMRQVVHPSWDERPWSFVLAVERNDALGLGRLTGFLRRGDETRLLEDAELVLVDGLVLIDATFSPLDVGDGGPWILLLRKKGDLVMPAGELAAFTEELWDLPTLPPLDLPAELELEQVRGTPERHITLSVADKAPSASFAAEVFFDYDGHRIAAETPPAGIPDRARRRILLRDMTVEQEALGQLAELGVRPIPGRPDTYQVQQKAFADTARELLASGWIVEAEGRRVRSAGSARWSVRSKIDWFELHGAIDFDGVAVGLPELLRAVRRGQRLVRLDDGTHGMLPEAWLEQYAALAHMASGDARGAAGDAVELLPSQAALLDVLLDARQDELEVDAPFEDLRRRLRSFERVEAAPEPEGFVGELRPYQRYGLGWLGFLNDFGFGGCLADDMGLGKTIQVLALLQDRADRRYPGLVVVPRSLVHNWLEEARRFTPDLRVLDYSQLSQLQRQSDALEDALTGHDVVVTTYGLVRRDVLALKDVRFDYVILDEAQAIKNAKSQAAKASRLLCARHRLVLTGTPVENHIGELWSLFEFLNPGMLGRLPALKGVGRSLEDGAAGRIVQALRPFILRRSKEQVLPDLPRKTEQTLYCELEDEERRLYDELRDHYRVQLDQRIETLGLGKSKIQVLEALLRLRQASCHPGLIDEKRQAEPSAKLDMLASQLDEVLSEGHKALVFSQFTRLLAIVRRQLDARGLVYEYLDGKTRNRRERVDRFQNDEDCRLFLISLKAGGVGLNLTAADYVFILDPWWNPAVESQAMDRAHRIGQTRPVFAYRLVCRDTVEEKILTLQQTKRQLADAILAEKSSLMRQLTADDMRILLS